MDIVCEIKTLGGCSSCKDVFMYYNNRKIEILNDIINNYKDQMKLLDVDQNCMWNLGSIFRKSLDSKVGANVNFNRKFKCHNCNILSKLVDVSIIRDELPYQFRCNSLLKDIIINKESNVNLYNKKESSEIKRIHSGSGGSSKGSGGTEFIYEDIIRIDSFTLRCILSWSLQNVISCVEIHTAFVCGNDGYTFSDVVSKMSLDNLSEGQIISILKKIIKILWYLRDYNFNLPSVESIGEVLTVTQGYQIKLNDLGNCFMSQGSIRLGPRKSLNSTTVKILDYQNLTGSRTLFKIESLQDYLNSGHSEFSSAINVYLIFLYLSKFPNIRKFIYGYQQPYDIFKGLWLFTDFKRLTLEPTDLEHFFLRKDALEYLKGKLDAI